MIETKRLILRQFEITDQEALESLLGDKEVMESSDDGPLNTEEVGEWLRGQIEESKKKNGIEILAVINKATSELIGYCGLTQFPDINGLSEIEVGYRFVRNSWGYGYATEAASAVRDYSFSKLNLSRLVALIEPINKRSIRVAEKLGMKYEKEIMLEDYDYPDYLYAIQNMEQNS